MEKKNRPVPGAALCFHGAPISRSHSYSQRGKRRWARNSTNWISVGTTSSPQSPLMCRPLTIDSLPVTNGEFFEFVESGSYDEERFWLPGDWKWKQLENKRHPNCWLKQKRRVVLSGDVRSFAVVEDGELAGIR